MFVGGGWVSVEDNPLGGGEPPLKLFEGGAGGSTKTIDSLVRIAHRKYVLLLAGEHFRKDDVAGIAILEFVDQNDAGTTLLLCEKLGMGPQQLDRPADLHAKGAQVSLLQQTHGIAVHARDLRPALDHLVCPQLIHVPAFA